MSCERNARRAGQAAGQSGLSRVAAGSAALAGRSGQALFFDRPAGGQAAFFEAGLPKGSEIRLAGAFTPRELQQLSIELGLGAAAIRRHLRQRRSKVPLARDQADPRPPDWARADLKQYQWLEQRLGRARRNEGRLNLAGLNRAGLRELWEFARYEADRAQRHLEQLSTPGGPYGSPDSPTSRYLMANHRRLARFFGFLAGELEPRLQAMKAGSDV